MTKAFLFATYCLLSLTLVTAQNPFPVDNNFGVDGTITLDIDSLDHCEVLLSDSDQNCYLLGYTGSSTLVDDRDFLICKVDSSGVLVSTFGTGGVLRMDLTEFQNSFITDGQLLDSAIYFCGNNGVIGSLDTQNVFVGKIDLNGNIDSNFGVNGFYTDTYISKYSDARTLHILNDHRILLAGMSFDTAVVHREISFFGRLLPDGTRDSSFGITGFRTWNTLSGLNQGMGHNTNERHIDGTLINDITPCVWGGYFLSGYFDFGQSFRILTMSVDTSGNFDSSYANNGVLIYDVNPTLKQRSINAHVHDNQMLLTIRPGNQGDIVLQKIDSTGFLSPPQYLGNPNNFERVEYSLITANDELLICGQSTETYNLAQDWSNYLSVLKVNANTLEMDSSFSDSVVCDAYVYGIEQAGAYSLTSSNDYLYVGGDASIRQAPTDRDLVILRLIQSDEIATMDAIESSYLSLYPNPSDGEIKLVQSSSESGSLRIYDSNGRLVYESIVEKGTNTFRLSLSTGIYYWQHASGEVVSSGKLIIQ